MSNSLLCGAAKRCITPDSELMGRLFSVMRGTVFTETDGDLFVRAIALKSGQNTVLFLAYELDQAPFPLAMIDEISREYGIPGENIFVLGNHSHEVPVTGIRAAEKQHNEQRLKPEYLEPTMQYEAQVLAAAREAVKEAMETMQKARLGWAEGTSDINARRGRADFPSVMPLDKSLFVMKIEAEDGTPIAVFLNYSSHNACIKSKSLLSADMEGCISRIMEDRFPGSVVMWTLSAHGDIMPREDYDNISFTITPPEFADPEKTELDALKRERILSLRQAEDAIEIVAGIECREIQDAEVSASVDYVDVETVAPLAGDDSGLPYHLRLHLVRFGDLVFIGNGGKLFNSFKLMMRSMLPFEFYGVMLSQDCCEDSTITYVRDERELRGMIAKGKEVGVNPSDVTKTMQQTVSRLMEKAGITPLE